VIFFTFLLKNVKNCDISATGFHEIWHCDAEWVSHMRWPLKKLILKIQHGRRLMHLRNPFCIIIRYRDFSIFKMAAVHHFGFLKLNF